MSKTRIDKIGILVFSLMAAFIISIFVGCSLISGLLSEASRNDGQLDKIEDSQVSGSGPQASEKNIAPTAVMEIYQQNSDGYYIEVGNPVYFTAENSFDGDGDELDYSWDISGNKNSASQTFEYIFDQTGIYGITLTVSDGKTEAVLKKQIEVVEIDDSIYC